MLDEGAAQGFKQVGSELVAGIRWGLGGLVLRSRHLPYCGSPARQIKEECRMQGCEGSFFMV